MLSHLDNLLRDLLLEQLSELNDDGQVRFQPPDESWRAYVSTLEGMALNIYLVDIRENRKLRSNERVRSYRDNIIDEEPAPARVDCHYLLSAWSPAIASATVEPTLDEHDLLYKTTAVLFHHIPLVPERIYAEGSAALLAWPERFRKMELPTVIVPQEGFIKLAELWSGMGTGARWKPVIYLIITLPVELLRDVAGPMVTTRITEYRQTGKPDTGEVIIKIGGHVLDATVDPVQPLADAWVQLETTTGVVLQTVMTNDLGRFMFERLQPGNYQLRWRAGARPEPAPRLIEVPSSSGEYDLRFE